MGTIHRKAEKVLIFDDKIGHALTLTQEEILLEGYSDNVMVLNDGIAYQICLSWEELGK